ncbi:MAG: ATP-binding protein [Holophaga sp.]|nr:ATP-binding protein [Holophaga sp.]
MRTEIEYPIEVKSDFLSKQTKASPIQAVAELIWNSVDAEATSVRVLAETAELGGIHSIRVEDNGIGIRHEDAPKLFSSLGGSWKLNARTTGGERRFLHGSEGRGRLKAFAIGSSVKWETTFQEKDEFLSFTVHMRAGSTKVTVSEPLPAKKKRTGTRCVITEVRNSPNSLVALESIQAMSEIFAAYLKIYSHVQITLPAGKIDPSSVIASTKTFPLDPIEADGRKFVAEVELVEWTGESERVLYLCNEQGFPLSKCEIRIHAPGLNFSAYLKSSYITELAHEGTLELGELATGIRPVIDQVRAAIKVFHRECGAHRAKNLVERWKEDKIYPFEDNPKTEMERVEREVFEVVAIQVNDLLPDFSSSQPKSQRFQLRMLRQALESSPAELEVILSEVLSLSGKKRQEFAELLKETSLSAMITASKMVSERLKTLSGLEKLLYDLDEKKQFKERTQLHRLLAVNSWIFGEEHNLLVDDQSLTEALRQHLKTNGDSTVVDRSVTLADGGRGILDLMLGQKVATARAEELEYLVVELKRPSVVVGSEEITQIEKYAQAVADDSRFHGIPARWTFWVISNDMDSFARRRASQAGAPRGRIHISDDPRMTVWIKEWSQVLHENKARLGLYQKHLELQANQDEGLTFLRAKHQELLPSQAVADLHAENEAVNQ